MIRYPSGTVLLALVQMTAYTKETLEGGPVSVPPDTVGVVSGVIEAVDNEYFVHFPSHGAQVLLEEHLVTERFTALTPTDVANLYQQLRTTNEALHRVIVALEANDINLAMTLARGEKQALMKALFKEAPP